jgi:hypothetical protein
MIDLLLAESHGSYWLALFRVSRRSLTWRQYCAVASDKMIVTAST